MLVFTRTKHGANRLANKLGRMAFRLRRFTATKSQNARTKALADFRMAACRCWLLLILPHGVWTSTNCRRW